MSTEQDRALARQLERACAQRPTVKNLISLANCYFRLGDTNSAIILTEKAYDKDCNDPGVLANLAVLNKDYGDHDAALKYLEVAYEHLDAKDDFTAFAYAESLLRAGRWEEAWPLWQKRPTKEESALIAGIPLELPEWDGKKPCRKLAIIDEGGIGDSITFSRYIKELVARKMEWVYNPFPELRGFYDRLVSSMVEGWSSLSIVREGARMDVTHWTTTMSLPAILRATPQNVPKSYEFTASTNLVKRFLLDNRKPCLGLVWRAGEKNRSRRVKSMTEGQAMRLVCRTDHLVNWVNLMHDASLPEPVENPKINTFEELAAVMKNLNGVVAVESGPMCLASAMGRNLIVILTSNNDWRTSFSKEFYPGAEVFHNDRKGSGIDGAIDKAIEHIKFIYDEKKRIKIVG